MRESPWKFFVRNLELWHPSSHVLKAFSLSTDQYIQSKDRVCPANFDLWFDVEHRGKELDSLTNLIVDGADAE
jgi:hypothetical protein